MTEGDPEALLRAAEAVLNVLEHHGIEALVISGVAVAAHRFLRLTDDIDLGVNAEIPKSKAYAVGIGCPASKNCCSKRVAPLHDLPACDGVFSG
ncbi:MAG: hypothetical protein AB7O66_05710 [Limisphaerales bacterium]